MGSFTDKALFPLQEIPNLSQQQRKPEYRAIEKIINQKMDHDPEKGQQHTKLLEGQEAAPDSVVGNSTFFFKTIDYQLLRHTLRELASLQWTPSSKEATIIQHQF